MPEQDGRKGAHLDVNMVNTGTSNVVCFMNVMLQSPARTDNWRRDEFSLSVMAIEMLHTHVGEL